MYYVAFINSICFHLRKFLEINFVDWLLWFRLCVSHHKLCRLMVTVLNNLSKVRTSITLFHNSQTKRIQHWVMYMTIYRWQKQKITVFDCLKMKNG